MRDLIWIEAAFLVDQEVKGKLLEEELLLSADIRVLIKDIDDVQRLKSSGKKNCLINWNDLPSQRSRKEDASTKKIFLRELSQQFKNK